jgi:BirA family biotin operon repressor/biotin-[acetyl-CoA-carboxylase] ligase
MPTLPRIHLNDRATVERAGSERATGERELLLRLAAGPATGEALAEAAGQTRAAVWKRIDGLRAAGVEIDASPGRGYSLRHPLELLDAAAIRGQLPRDAHTQLGDLEVAWSLDSTNSELLRRPAPAAGCLVLLAERQTGGRGRRGRAWASPLAAHLYLSLARGFSGGLARLGGLSLVAGIAAAEALQALGVVGVRLKWPNDLVVEECTAGRAEGRGGLRKLGGLLVEGGGELGGPARAVIGLGLNVRMPAVFAAQIGQPWIDLATLCWQAPSRNTLAAALLARLLPALEEFDRDGLAPFLPRYAALDALAGRVVTVQLHDGERHGTALGIGTDGALRVRLHEGGECAFHSGEVSVRAVDATDAEA